MNNSDNPVYLVAQLDVKNVEDFLQRYGSAVIGQLQKVGAKVLAATSPQVLEGDQVINRTVILQFPSLDVATQWYESEEYRALKELRINELTNSGTAVFVEAFDASLLD
ncbi:DUF1330 domain-containing protein [Haliea sp. AH-315-K21]|uniref:D-fructose-6-phosphate amidotransferase n=1 Tax=SAR86 cluster bacterium TaxID=2030880 RepID=A0A2A5C8A1_9GAMM|nr:DUF1330 domain-containing protein [Haliea sp. AH-315-K21]MBN4075698.1 DUF1330 domain-containing protein [Gammaproteobacteria bacterium AH-315-E17]PCJ39973.1 MAG: D-fructose-6-phosphate amidotransferase [SAR86 cluster bacterium]